MEDFLFKGQAVAGAMNDFVITPWCNARLLLVVSWRDEEYDPYCNLDLAIAVHGSPVMISTCRDRYPSADLV